MREQLLVAAIQSGALLLAVWAIFRAFPAIPANAKAWIWRVAFLKPLACLLPFAVMLRVLSPDPVEAAASTTRFVTATGPAVSSMAVVPPPVEAPAAIDPLFVVWLVGAALYAAHGAWSWARANRIVRYADPVTEPAFLWMLENLCVRAEVSAPVELLTSPDLESAMLLCGRRAAIVLPQSVIEAGAADDARLMLAHEVAHLARRDLAWFGLAWIVQAGFFFSPAVWLAARAFRLDHESATDRYAAELAAVPVQTYADMLLRATVVARTSIAPGVLPMAESYRTIHRRLEAMKHFNIQPTRRRQLGIAALALATAGLLPSYQLAQAEPQAKPAKVGVQPKQKSKVKTKAKSKPAKAGTTWKLLKNGKISVDKNGKTTVIATPARKAIDSPTARGVGSVNAAPGAAVAGDGEIQGEGVVVASGEAGRPALGGGVAVGGNGRPGLGGNVIVGENGASAHSSSSSSASGSSSSNASGTSSGSAGGSASGSGSNQAGAGSSGGPGTSTGSSNSTNQNSGSSTGNSSTNTTGSSSGTTTGSAGGGIRAFGPGEAPGFNFAGMPAMPGMGENSNQSSTASIATNGNGKTTSVTYKFERYDVRQALRMAFEQTGRNFRIEPNVRGNVTLSGTNATPDAVLRSLARSANAEIRLEKGVYVVSAKKG